MNNNHKHKGFNKLITLIKVIITIKLLLTINLFLKHKMYKIIDINNTILQSMFNKIFQTQDILILRVEWIFNRIFIILLVKWYYKIFLIQNMNKTVKEEIM